MALSRSVSGENDSTQALPPGRVTIVGAGPGHPDYLTLKGLRVLQQADVIAYDALLDKSFRFLFPKKAFRIFVGKRCGNHTLAQEDIHRLMIRHARQGKRVVRLKGGDPFVYGRGGEEWLSLTAAGVAVDVVPGVSSLQAAGALAGVPLTHRGLANAVLTLECHRESLERYDWPAIAAFLTGFDATLAILMGSRRVAVIAQRLMAGGVDPATPVALVENATLAAQCARVAPLSQAAAGELTPLTDGPGVLYLGPTVALRALLRDPVGEYAPQTPQNVLNSGMMAR
ncbi:MAG: uroporphyrinogen-III C-methyltransferase [Vampirovibrionales bacterium]|nr:uroporphyrinogen-III C-methyltransferase [Vampirovibrionales bacterium]